MGDLIERLKGGTVFFEAQAAGMSAGDVNDDATDRIMAEAAAEIERLTARVAELEAERDKLREALRQIEFEARGPQESYDQNGPTWTSRKTGDEYENTSDFLAFANSIADRARAALARGDG